MAEPEDKPLAWLHGEIKTPPFDRQARIRAGWLLRRLQQGEMLSLPHSRPMPQIGTRCHELRVGDKGLTWRILYRIDPDAIVVLDVFAKKTSRTPEPALEAARRRLQEYDDA